MWLLLIFIILAGAYAYCFSLFGMLGLSSWFWFLWVFLGILFALLTIAIYILCLLKIGSKTSPKGNVRHFVLYQVVLWILFVLHAKVVIEGKENIPEGTYVLYGNHKSMVDPVLLYYGVHMKIAAAGKSTLFKNKIMRNLGDTFGTFYVNREDDKESARNMVNAIKQVKDGLPMMIFPEGGIKSRETEKMVDLKPGAYKLATKAHAPIVPVTIVGSSKFYHKPLWKKITVKLIFHKPITEEEYKQMNTTELGERVESIINGDIHE